MGPSGSATVYRVREISARLLGDKVLEFLRAASKRVRFHRLKSANSLRGFDLPFPSVLKFLGVFLPTVNKIHEA